MAKDFDLTSQKWLDLVFKGKNKEYGAYVLRDTSSDRHLKALIIVTIIGLALVYLPGFIKGLIPEKVVDVEDEIISVGSVDMTNIQQDVPEENIIRQLEAVPPPPALKKTIQFTIPKVVEDDQVDRGIVSQEDLTQSDAAISTATVADGVKDGVDIADLEDNKVIIQDDNAEDIIHEFVEQPPRFPGGETALAKWLKDNINYPQIAIDQGVQGRVVVRFVVSPDGSIGKAEVVRQLDPSCDREALRVVQKMPKWEPGRQNGTAVHVYFLLPIAFSLGSR